MIDIDFYFNSMNIALRQGPLALRFTCTFRNLKRTGFCTIAFYYNRTPCRLPVSYQHASTSCRFWYGPMRNGTNILLFSHDSFDAL